MTLITKKHGLTLRPRKTTAYFQMEYYTEYFMKYSMEYEDVKNGIFQK